ncbi:MAG: class I SAM-dependent methyltransferase [Candidatus Magasanikbacteria bacterium]|nr:class I SAM-dependent methyltransferase [Candidatus Magasanikbacteria bacterium]
MKLPNTILCCAVCHTSLETIGSTSVCKVCGFSLENKNGILVENTVTGEKDKEFYDHIYSGELGEKWFQGLNRTNILKKILEKISLSYRRERFFKRNIKGSENIILDIACGAGRDYFKKYGAVVGVDLSYEALDIAKKDYDMVIQGGVNALPFLDNTFDYVLTSDFFGHVRNEDKDVIMKEINRVLKPGGKTLNVIENDSANVWFRFAHQYPELFQKYFIEKIGGHIGLELLDACVERWKQNNFTIVKAEKIWGTIWPIQDYAYLFDNEYKQKSSAIRVIVALSKTISKIKILQIGVNILLNPINWIVEKIMPLNNGQGLMLIGQKPSSTVYSFSGESSGTHALILDQVRPETTILDVGCSTGYLGEYLIQNKKCMVYGIESDAPSHAIALSKGYETVALETVEDALSSHIFEGKKFDHIIIGDVLEHVVDPSYVLKEIKKYLAEQGTIIISLPNVAHYSVRFALLRGKWDMTDTGIMDRTHLHFFTLKTAKEMIGKTGYEIEMVRPRGDLERWFRKISLESVGRRILEWCSSFFAIQYIFVVRVKSL